MEFLKTAYPIFREFQEPIDLCWSRGYFALNLEVDNLGFGRLDASKI